MRRVPRLTGKRLKNHDFAVVSGAIWRLQLIRAFDSRLVTDRVGAPSGPAARRAARARRAAVVADHAGGAEPGAESAMSSGQGRRKGDASCRSDVEHLPRSKGGRVAGGVPMKKRAYRSVDVKDVNAKQLAEDLGSGRVAFGVDVAKEGGCSGQSSWNSEDLPGLGHAS